MKTTWSSKKINFPTKKISETFTTKIKPKQVKNSVSMEKKYKMNERVCICKKIKIVYNRLK